MSRFLIYQRHAAAEMNKQPFKKNRRKKTGATLKTTTGAVAMDGSPKRGRVLSAQGAGSSPKTGDNGGLPPLTPGEGKYRSILETMEEAYFETDLKGSFLFFNPAMCRIVGYEPDELMGMNFRAISTPESAKSIFSHYREASVTGVNPGTVIAEITRKDGTRRMVELSASLLRGAEGEPAGFRGIGRDVTERLQTQQSLRESEKRYRLL
ncbi:MAG TPA: PAS domain S-box protein, partial [Smithellaceae bacterium]|nr:PAS domain S-box protein [Smithellaceae bacterium]